MLYVSPQIRSDTSSGKCIWSKVSKAGVLWADEIMGIAAKKMPELAEVFEIVGEGVPFSQLPDNTLFILSALD